MPNVIFSNRKQGLWAAGNHRGVAVTGFDFTRHNGNKLTSVRVIQSRGRVSPIVVIEVPDEHLDDVINTLKQLRDSK